MTTPALPEAFAELEYLVNDGWAAPLRVDRTEKRLASTMQDIRSFYDVMVPRLGEILAYLDQFQLKDLPPREECLLNLCFGVVEIRNAVESFNQPDTVDGWDTRKYHIASII